ncbi:hypothetical protein pb186bvf_020610 [Paramecium bursaria]
MKLKQTVDKKIFPKELENQAINLLVYGQLIDKLKDDGTITQEFFYIHEDIPFFLQYYDVKKQIKIHTIDLLKIDFITAQIQDSKKYKLDPNTMLFILLQKNQYTLSFKNKQIRDLWWQGLNYFIDYSQEYIIKPYGYILAQRLFQQCDPDGDSVLDKKEIAIFTQNLKTMNPLVDIQKLLQIYQINPEYLEFKEFYEIISKLLHKDELLGIYKQYSEKLIKQDNLPPDLNFNQFQEKVFSVENSIFDPEKEQIDDMDQTLSNYYINSSHNTYLTANQLTGTSSVNAYVQAIKKGYCWDGADGKPIIYHGYTMTTKILFEDVIIAINKFAFIYSSYPMILSLELHCSVKQQEVLGEIMRKYFGDQLYVIQEEMQYLPSPNQLKRKILVKSTGTLEEFNNIIRGHKIKSTHVSPRASVMYDQIITFEEEPDAQFIPQTERKQRYNNLNLKKNLNYNKAVIHQYVRGNVQEDFDRPMDQMEMVLTKQSNVKHSPKFISCLTLFNTPFNFNVSSIWNISSLSEDKILQLFKKKELDICQFLTKQLVRVYPGGHRVDSSNYDPMPSFVVGAQIVALNFQTNDINMLINLSKFQENGNIQSGYVLKPQYLRQGTKIPSDFQEVAMLLKIRVISCSKLNLISQESINPYIEICVKGNPIDEDQNFPFKSKTVMKNAINPFYDETAEFDIYDIEQAMIIFQVFDYQMKTHLLGWYGISLNCMREGYRVVRLRGQDLEYMEDTYILVHIQKQLK